MLAQVFRAAFHAANHVGADGVFGDAQLLSDLFFRETIDFGKGDDLAAPGGQAAQRIGQKLKFLPRTDGFHHAWSFF